MLGQSLLEFNKTKEGYLRNFIFVVYGNKQLYNNIIDHFEKRNIINISIEYFLCSKTIRFSSTLWPDESMYVYDLHPNQLKELIANIIPEQTIPIVWFNDTEDGVSIDRDLIITKHWICDN